MFADNLDPLLVGLVVYGQLSSRLWRLVSYFRVGLVREFLKGIVWVLKYRALVGDVLRKMVIKMYLVFLLLCFSDLEEMARGTRWIYRFLDVHFGGLGVTISYLVIPPFLNKIRRCVKSFVN